MDERDFARRAEDIKARLYPIAYGYLNVPSAAVDVVDEAIYRGYLACKKLREDAYFNTWMTRILINLCLKELKRQKREQPWADPSQARQGELSQEDYDSLPLKDAIAALPKELREVVLLRFFGDCTLAQTAEILEIPRGTVSSRQQRALALLRLVLQEEEEPLDAKDHPRGTATRQSLPKEKRAETKEQKSKTGKEALH